MDWKIPLFKIYWDEEDVRMVTDTIRRGMSWAIGPHIEKFETLLADYVGTKYAVVFNSGTSALHAALLAHGIGEGGVMVTNSSSVLERMQLIRSHGRLQMQNYFSSAEYLDYVTVGYNFRMSDITAALGIAQLKKIAQIIKMRRENSAYSGE